MVRIARIEELTRIPAEVQDALIMILSEKTLPFPELGQETQAVAWVQCDRDGERSGQGDQRAVVSAASTLQHCRHAAAEQRG